MTVRGDRGGLLQGAVDKRAGAIRAWWKAQTATQKEAQL